MAILRLTPDREGERCDQFLSRQLPELSRSAAQRLLGDCPLRENAVIET